MSYTTSIHKEGDIQSLRCPIIQVYTWSYNLESTMSYNTSIHMVVLSRVYDVLYYKYTHGGGYPESTMSYNTSIHKEGDIQSLRCPIIQIYTWRGISSVYDVLYYKYTQGGGYPVSTMSYNTSIHMEGDIQSLRCPIIQVYTRRGISRVYDVL